MAEREVTIKLGVKPLSGGDDALKKVGQSAKEAAAAEKLAEERGICIIEL